MPQDPTTTYPKPPYSDKGRAGQPVELAPSYVMLASDEWSYMTGVLIPVSGGRPML